MMYGNLSAAPSNDCPDPSAPPGVSSLTISGIQTDGNGAVSICVSRPDRIDHTLETLDAYVHLIGLTGTVGQCSLALDPAVAPVGVVNSTGVCDNGAAHVGFMLVIYSRVSMTRTCASVTDTLSAMFAGSVAVAGP